MTKKPTTKRDDAAPASPAPTPGNGAKKKNLSLDVSDVSEVLERKISP